MERRAKILWVNLDGHERLLTRLEALGFDVTRVRLSPEVRWPGESWIRFSAECGLRVDVAAIRAFGRLVGSLSPDLVHVGGARRVAQHAMAALWLRRKVAVILDRGAIGGINLLNPADWLTFFTRPNQSIRCTSQAVAAGLSPNIAIRPLLPAGRLEVLPIPIPEFPGNRASRKEARHELGLDPEAFIAGTICRVRPIKNLAPMAEAVCSLRSIARQVQFAVIGEASHQAEMRRILARSAAHPPIFLGVQPNAWRLLNAFDIFVSPTRPPGEGFGLALAEAMMAGLPVVTGDSGAGTELVGNGTAGLIVRALDVADWRSAILRLAEDSQLRQQLGQAAATRARTEFRDEVVADRLAEIYRRRLQTA